MEKKVFPGYRVLIGSCIYMFVAVGMTCVFFVSLGVLPAYLGESLQDIMSVYSVNMYSAALLSLFVAGRVIGKIKPKKLMICGGFLMLVYAFIIGSKPNLIGLGIAFVFSGTVVALAMHAATTALLTNWFVDKRATVIGINVAAGIFGTSVYQFAFGRLLVVLGINTTYYVVGIISCALMILGSLLVINEPKEIGGIALGEKKASCNDIPVIEMPGRVSSRKILLKSPAFWLVVAAAMLGDSNVMIIVSFATTYFPSFGMSFTTAATLVSALSLAGAAYAFISGFIMDKVGVKVFIIMIFIAGSLAYSMTVMYAANQSMIIIVFLFIGFMIGYPATNLSCYIVSPFFGTRLATEANALLIAFALISNATLLPIFTRIAAAFSFQILYTVLIFIDIVAMVLYLIAYGLGKKRVEAKDA